MLVNIIKKFLNKKMVELNSDLNADQRVIFTGPSTSILRELHESFILEGDLATIDLGLKFRNMHKFAN